MLALALLFLLIIMLLVLLVRLLQNFFDVYNNYLVSDSIEHNELLKSKGLEESKVEKEINTIIHERLMKMEQKFPSFHNNANIKHEEAEALLVESLKHILNSYSRLLKVKTEDTNS